MLARDFWWAISPKLGPAMVQRDPCEMEMVTCLGNLLLFWWDIVGCWTPMCPGGCCRDPGLTLQAPGHCFSVAFTKMQMCSDETPHHPGEGRAPRLRESAWAGPGVQAAQRLVCWAEGDVLPDTLVPAQFAQLFLHGS